MSAQQSQDDSDHSSLDDDDDIDSDDERFRTDHPDEVGDVTACQIWCFVPTSLSVSVNPSSRSLSVNIYLRSAMSQDSLLVKHQTHDRKVAS